MAHIAARIASGLAAAGIATIMTVAPAQAMRPPDPTECSVDCTNPPATSETPWLKITLGAAGGVALAVAGAATVSSRQRQQRHSPTRHDPVAG